MVKVHCMIRRCLAPVPMSEDLPAHLHCAKTSAQHTNPLLCIEVMLAALLDWSETPHALVCCTAARSIAHGIPLHLWPWLEPNQYLWQISMQPFHLRNRSRPAQDPQHWLCCSPLIIERGQSTHCPFTG